MGLDCVPLGRAKPGHEKEWSRLMETLYEGRGGSEADRDRRLEISILPYEGIGAPQVGTDPAADQWLLERKDPDSKLSDNEFLNQHRGYHVVELLSGECDGVPRYSNGALYGPEEPVDRASFRGAFLESCEPLIGRTILERAWTTVMRPKEAVAYGHELLAAVARAKNGELLPQEPHASVSRWVKWLGRERRRADTDDTPLEEQIDILEVAGRWYLLWGSLGHPIWTYY